MTEIKELISSYVEKTYDGLPAWVRKKQSSAVDVPSQVKPLLMVSDWLLPYNGRWKWRQIRGIAECSPARIVSTLRFIETHIRMFDIRSGIFVALLA